MRVRALPRVADTTPPAFALAYVGTGTPLSVLNRVGVEPPAGHVLAWLGACGVIAYPGGEFVPTRGEQNWRCRAGAWCAPGRGGVLVVASGWWWLGRGASPLLVVGLGWW